MGFGGELILGALYGGDGRGFALVLDCFFLEVVFILGLD